MRPHTSATATVVAAALAAIGAVMAAIGLAQSAGTVQEGFGLGVVLAALLYSAAFISLPMISAVFVVRGRSWPRHALVLIAIGDVATTSLEPWVLVGTAATAAAAVVAWLPVAVRFSTARATAATARSLTRGWPRTTVDAYLWWLLTGFVGGHLFYLGRAWQGLLYIVLVCLAIVSVPTIMAFLFLAVVTLFLFIDAERIPGWVSAVRWSHRR